MTVLYAQPFDRSATGFFFESLEEYNNKASTLKNDYGDPVEELEIHFNDGESIDAKLFDAIGIYQNDIGLFFNACEEWDDYQKINVIIAAGEVGYSFDLENDDPDNSDIDIYEMDSLKDLTYYFVDEGLFGEIPDNLINYLDYDIIARDLGMDYTETRIAGVNYVYRCD